AERVLAALAGTQRRMTMKPVREDASVLVARDLSPADVILFREHPFAAFITDMGGATSHTAIVNPDKHVLAEYRIKQNQARIERDKLKRLRTAPASTLDGTMVQLQANI